MSDKGIIGVIPARYGSTRFPGKPLALIAGKPMVVRVAENAMRSKLLDRIIVATDDDRIAEVLKDAGIDHRMTPAGITSGTDRCWYAVKDEQCSIVVNIQGDEPLLDPNTVDSLIKALDDSGEVCSTPVSEICDVSDINDPNVVKTVTDNSGHALYFSRSAVPYEREDRPRYLKHIGIYAFRYEFLRTFTLLERTANEKCESLEQLRILDNGYRIKCVTVSSQEAGVDIPSDILKIEKILTGKKEK